VGKKTVGNTNVRIERRKPTVVHRVLEESRMGVGRAVSATGVGF